MLQQPSNPMRASGNQVSPVYARHFLLDSIGTRQSTKKTGCFGNNGTLTEFAPEICKKFNLKL